MALSPEGRGQVVSHALYQPQELEKIHRELAAAPAAEASDGGDLHGSSGAPDVAGQPPRQLAAQSRPSDASPGERNVIAELRAEVAALRRHLDELTSEVHRRGDEIDRLRASLGA